MTSPPNSSRETRTARDVSDVVQIGDGAPLDVDASADVASLDVIATDRYEIRRELATGGMGRIFEAWDVRNRRTVAVKVLLRAGPDALRRFVREARITARLQHPAIVPLYDAGRWPSGEPLFAMKLVAGRPLSEVAADARTIEERLALVPHMLAATEALAYAHEQRVVHRDLKPSNVLVGAFGETVVIDWGLAKDLDAARDDGDEGAPARDASLTAIGKALGTPSYMPPEQARGDEVDERADVYALGAMMYRVLAGEAPYAGSSSDEIIARVIDGPPAPLATRAPEVPPDLATIVTKAMARDPADRYPSAKDMAADLRRFSNGQLVSAHAYSLGTLLGRWVRRHRGVVAMTAALVIAVGVTAGLAVRRVVRERDRADAAHVIAERERASAITRRDAAERLVGFVISELRDRLKRAGRLDALAGVGAQVDGYYETTAALGDENDADAIQRRAAALETLAEVEDARHAPAEARGLYDRARTARRRVIALRGDEDARAAEVELVAKIARHELDFHGAATALPVAREAATLATGTSPRELVAAADAHGLLAKLLGEVGDPNGAADEAARAVEIARSLAALEPDSARALRVLGAALLAMGRVDYERGLFDTPFLEESVTVRERLVAMAPDGVDDRLALSESWLRRALALRNKGRISDALAAARRMVALREEAAARDLDNTESQRLLSVGYDTLASIQMRALDSEAATESARRAIAIAERVMARNPSAPTIGDSLLLAYQRLGWIALKRKRFDEADGAFRSSLAIAERFAAADATDLTWTSRAADALGFLADIARQQGRTDVAIREMRRAVALLDPLERRSPSYSTQRSIIIMREELAWQLGPNDAAEARALHVAALDLFVRLPDADATEEEVLTMLAKACVALLPSASPELRATITKAIAKLEPIRVKGSSPDARLAALACARRL